MAGRVYIPTPARADIKASTNRGRAFESLGNRLREGHAANVEELGQEQARLGIGAGSAVQQKFKTPAGGSFASKLEQNLRRGKARQGIVNRGDNAIRNQQLKDRLQLAKSSVVRRGALQKTSSDALRIRNGLEASKLQSSQQVGQAFAGAAGFISGSAIRGFSDFNDSTTPVEEDASFYGTGAGRGSFDAFG